MHDSHEKVMNTSCLPRAFIAVGSKFSTPMNGWFKTTSDQHMLSSNTQQPSEFDTISLWSALSSGLDFATCSSAQVGDWQNFRQRVRQAGPERRRRNRRKGQSPAAQTHHQILGMALKTSKQISYIYSIYHIIYNIIYIYIYHILYNNIYIYIYHI